MVSFGPPVLAHLLTTFTRLARAMAGGALWPRNIQANRPPTEPRGGRRDGEREEHARPPSPPLQHLPPRLGMEWQQGSASPPALPLADPLAPPSPSTFPLAPFSSSRPASAPASFLAFTPAPRPAFAASLPASPSAFAPASPPPSPPAAFLSILDADTVPYADQFVPLDNTDQNGVPLSVADTASPLAFPAAFAPASPLDSPPASPPPSPSAALLSILDADTVPFADQFVPPDNTDQNGVPLSVAATEDTSSSVDSSSSEDLESPSTSGGGPPRRRRRADSDVEGPDAKRSRWSDDDLEC